MCHNCHLIIVDTNENINESNNILKEVKSLMDLKFINENKDLVNKLNKIKSSTEAFAQKMKAVNGTKGTSDQVLKMNADFNQTIKELKMLQKQSNYSTAAKDFIEKQDLKSGWMKKYIDTVDLTILNSVIESLDEFSEEAVKNGIEKFANEDTFKKEFRKMKISYTREFAGNKGLWQGQRNSFMTQIMATKNIEEFNSLVELIESRATMNRRLIKEMNNVIDGIKQVGMTALIGEGIITHEDHSNISKITFKLKKEENDDTVTFEIDDLGNTRYILGDYHSEDYQGEKALEREEADLEKIQQDLLAFGFSQSEPSFQSRFGFHSNKSFKLKEMEMK